jgi:hypothetical protein
MKEKKTVIRDTLGLNDDDERVLLRNRKELVRQHPSDLFPSSNLHIYISCLKTNKIQ